jgi:hypothetical protein
MLLTATPDGETGLQPIMRWSARVGGLLRAALGIRPVSPNQGRNAMDATAKAAPAFRRVWSDLR